MHWPIIGETNCTVAQPTKFLIGPKSDPQPTAPQLRQRLGFNYYEVSRGYVLQLHSLWSWSTYPLDTS